jgi:simple sugar transport system ATP-binding protein
VLSARDIVARDRTGRERLRGVSLDVRAGEIVGLAGVAGNGQDELVECLVGLDRPVAGCVELGGVEVTRAPVAARRQAGLGYVPADRRRDGLSVQSSVAENVLAGSQRHADVARHGWLRRGAAARLARSVIERYRVRCGDVGVPAGTLSGGNQQRLILGRELLRDPRVLVASQPTRGVDVAGAAYIREQIIALRDRGVGVLLVSEELDELAALSDRIVVLSGGRVAGEVQGPVRDLQSLGHLMTKGSA